jgi:DNA-binding LacI/PurR family transcriptional regulator
MVGKNVIIRDNDVKPIYGNMEYLPKRTSLVHETAAAVKNWIETGLLSGMLPGELQLKKRLGVGRDTLRLALQLLEKEGWVTPTIQGRQRKVQGAHLPALSASTSRLPVSFISPYSVVDRIVLLEMEDLQIHLTEQGRSLNFLSPNIFHLKNPQRKLHSLVHEHPSAAWVLYHTGGSVQHWFENAGIPAFIYGSPFPDTKLPFVVNDWEAAAVHAGLQLLRYRHHFICLLQDRDPSPGSLVVEHGLRRALASARSAVRLTVVKAGPPPVEIVRALAQLFDQKPRPTALVVNGSGQLLTSLSWMVSRGIRVPADISLVSPPSDSWFEELYPPICYYQSNSKVFARHVSQRVMELVETGRVTRKSIKVRMEYKPGASIGPAPQL